MTIMRFFILSVSSTLGRLDIADAQLARRMGVSASQAELEQRLRTVTEALVQKQSQLEAAVAEKSALGLQLETERRRPREEPRRDHAVVVDDDGTYEMRLVR